MKGWILMKHTVLLVVDVQNLMIEDKPYNITSVISNIRKLLSAARAGHTEVIYIRHDDGAGSDLEAGTKGWEIYNEIAPEPGERIIDKNYNSAFRSTGLKDYLEGKSVKTIILTGLQTDYCIDATCKSAFEFGYNVIIPEETNSTYDNEYLPAQQLYQYYNFKMWNNRYARILSLEEVLKLLQ